MPKANNDYWRLKVARNRRRDALITYVLLHAGWRVIRIWEHELVARNETRLIRRIRRAVDTGTKRDRKGRKITPVPQRAELVAAYRTSGLTMEQFAK
jgi:G:T-mismatch repair DNA endonuclease (very short patch repair protein)